MHAPAQPGAKSTTSEGVDFWSRLEHVEAREKRDRGAVDIAPRLQNRNLRCPKCDSSDVQRLAVVWRGGTSGIEARTTGIGIGGGGLGVGMAETKGTQQTVLAQGAAPPEQKLEGVWWLGVAFGVMLLVSALVAPGSGLIAFGTLFTGLCGVVAWANHQFNTREFPDLYLRWEKSFLCHRCGHQFVAEQF